MGLDRVLKSSHKSTHNCSGDAAESRINSSTRVRKLSSEVTPLGKEEAKSNAESISGQVEPLFSDYAAVGLSCVESREAGELSCALGVVDKLLLDFDMGPSLEFDTRKTEVVKSPPVLSAKGVKSLAIRADHKQSREQTGIYDWTGSSEYEGTADKRKMLYPENRGEELGPYSCSEKPRHHSSTVITGPVDKSGGKEGLNVNICQKVKCSVPRGSRLTQYNSIHSENIHIPETETMNLYKDTDGEPNSKFPIQNMDLANVIEDEETVYIPGPDTQMAAEAMESLFYASPANHELAGDAPSTAGNLTAHSRRGATMVRPFFNVSLQKNVSYSHDSSGMKITSKREKVPHNRISRGRSRTSSRHSSSSALRNKKEKRKLDGYSTVRGSIKTSESIVLSKRKKMGRSVDDIFASEIQENNNSMMINGQLSVSKELIHSEQLINATPVAHWTRLSKSKATSKLSETSSCTYRKPINERSEVNNPGLRIGEDKLAVDISVPLRSRGKGHFENINRHASSCPEVQEPKTTTLIEDAFSHPKRRRTCHNTGQGLTTPKEKPKTTSLIEDAFSHPKRRRTCYNTGQGLTKANLNSPSISNNGVLAATMLTYTRRRKIDTRDKTLPEVLEGAKWKKRSVSTHLPSKNGGNTCNTTEKSERPSVDTKLQVNSPSFKPHSENDSNVFSVKPDSEFGSENGNHKAATPMKKRVPLKEVGLPNQGTDSVTHIKDVKENAKLDGSPKDKGESCGLVCTVLKKVNTKSSSGHYTGRPPCKKSLPELSTVKEFVELSAPESAFCWPLKESRRRKKLSTVRIFFSNNLKNGIVKQQKKIMARLGVLTASSITDATHFVADKFARTRNMLEAMAMGKPVVTHMWIESCGQTSCFIDEKRYILRDLKKEKEIGFSMPVSLSRARQFPLLQGKRVFITPNTKPDRELVSSLVIAAQGQPMEKLGRFEMKADKVPDDLIVISCEEDHAVCRHLIERGAEIFSPELLLNGIVIQKLEFKRLDGTSEAFYAGT